MTDDARPFQSLEERRRVASDNLAKYFCTIAGLERVDSADGSQNWWIFVKEAEAVYDGIVSRFPPLPEGINP